MAHLQWKQHLRIHRKALFRTYVEIFEYSQTHPSENMHPISGFEGHFLFPFKVLKTKILMALLEQKAEVAIPLRSSNMWNGQSPEVQSWIFWSNYRRLNFLNVCLEAPRLLITPPESLVLTSFISRFFKAACPSFLALPLVVIVTHR